MNFCNLIPQSTWSPCRIMLLLSAIPSRSCASAKVHHHDAETRIRPVIQMHHMRAVLRACSICKPGNCCLTASKVSPNSRDDASSAFFMWLTSYSSSATGKYRSISADITIAFACVTTLALTCLSECFLPRCVRQVFGSLQTPLTGLPYGTIYKHGKVNCML